MIRTLSYRYDSGRWVPVKEPSAPAVPLWRGDDLAARSVEGVAQIFRGGYEVR